MRSQHLIQFLEQTEQFADFFQIEKLELMTEIPIDFRNRTLYAEKQ